MSKYLRLFETQSAYEAAESGLMLPNVSLTVDNNTVHYNPWVSPYNGHEYVDLGLPSGTKWATMNVGASSETDYGNYYQYGKGSDDYSVTSGQSVYRGTEDPLATSADTAAQVMGGQWHMPTRAQCQELINNTTSAWTTDYQGSGISGVVLTSKADTNVKLFLPAAGSCSNGNVELVGSRSYYYSSTPRDGNKGVWNFYYYNGYGGLGGLDRRSIGFPIRGVVG